MKICVFLANGFEEVEGLTVVDLVRRAGIEVTTVSVQKEKTVTGAHNIAVLADELLDELDAETFAGVVLPGGMPGTRYLNDNEKVCDIVKRFASQGKMIAAICAAPTVFGSLGLLEGKEATCYPGMEDGLGGARFVEEGVVIDGNMITSRGVGTAIDFALSIIEYLLDESIAKNIAKQIVYR